MLSLSKCFEKLDDEIVSYIQDYVAYSGTLSGSDIAHIADLLIGDVEHWVGLEVLNEGLLDFFAAPSEQLKRAVAEKDYQEVGVLLSEHVHNELEKTIDRTYDDLYGGSNFYDY